MGEFAPPGSNARMTKAQVRRYVANMKEAQRIAEEKLEKAKESGELDEKDILLDLEEKLKDL